MSKMGISVISSYRGGCNFEAVGLSRAVVAEFFPGMPSRISGIGILGIESKLRGVHEKAWRPGAEMLPIGGIYKARRKGEAHAWGAEVMHAMQAAVSQNSYALWKKYSDGMKAQQPIHLRDLLDFKPMGPSVPLEEVESITSIRKRFVTPGMSLGALSPEAHKALNVAMNRIGAKSDSGEGGEDPKHYHPEPNGDNPSAKIKQVASGRFGVTGVQRQVEKVHARAWGGGDAVLPIGGFYKSRRSGESHAWEAQAMHILQAACERGSYDLWKQYSRAMQARPPIHLRDLLDFQPKHEAVALDQVESITAIRKRFVTPGMSLGALSPEAGRFSCAW
jgi:glutamate synthase domain-containing protein 2